MISIFTRKPFNYQKIDETVSRSGQPTKNNIKWLKRKGVTDIINFRMGEDLKFNEKEIVEKNGIKYHSIPSSARKPSEEAVGQFLDIVEGIKEKGGKVHIHCLAGADRTGMYSWIYKQKNGLGEMKQNENEMIRMGHDYIKYPRLIHWITEYLYKGWR